MSISEHLKLAALLNVPGAPLAQDLLATFVESLSARGLQVMGLLQETRREQGQKKAMDLVEIGTGKRFSIKQNLGKSAGCQVDTQGVAEATEVLRRALSARPALVVINKFSHLESEGQGLAAEMLALMAEGIPGLTTVTPEYVEAWDRFTGGLAAVLEPSGQALQDWWQGS
jgi:nucleoside-triphosphatase THEP1